VNDGVPFPRYIPRTDEERKIIRQVAEVQARGKSRAVLLYGQGGTGKTRLVRHLPENADTDRSVIWLDPIDVDDSQHWLLSNLELYVAHELDPGNQYFRPYLEYVYELPKHSVTATNRDTVLSRLNRIKAIFARCYKNYIEGTGKSVVITFDTVEAIRGMHLLRTLTQWMKALPGTLFILAGRPLAGADNWRASIRAALEDPPHDMNVTILSLGEFSVEACREYLSQIRAEANLSEEETEKLICLTQGHPLWLALTIDYLVAVGMPVEAAVSLEMIRTDLPYHGHATDAGRARAESFKRRLVAPYQGTDFWHEAIKRLAVVRESVSEPIWQQLMADRLRADDVPDPHRAWETLGGIEWIRPRANRRYVTLHDALAEELAQRIIQVQDQDQKWRHELWQGAARIYAETARQLEEEVTAGQAAVDDSLHSLNLERENSSPRKTSEEEATLVKDVAELDGRKQELNQLKAARLFYQLLCDFSKGAEQFVSLLSQALEHHDVLFEDLLAFQMQRFLPGGADTSTLGDTVGAAISRFRSWLVKEGSDSYVDIGLSMAAYLINREQTDAAHGLLDQLPVRHSDHRCRYRLLNLQGNACLRTPGHVRESGEHFEGALAEARQIPLPDRHRFMAEAYKELGFYYRNMGHWEKADEAYRKASDAISGSLSAQSPASDREELASINNNWAYLKGIGGSYDDGISLIESAIDVRRRLNRHHERAISFSVKGEVYRYQRQFIEAWTAYEEARQLFEEQSSWSWLGLIYQEQAICLFQSIPAKVLLLDSGQDPLEHAKSLILESLDLCRDLNARAYPSALNRAGRIFGHQEPDRGLSYLLEGAQKARALSDGWFWLANLIEYAELSYRSWIETQDQRFLRQIPEIADQLQDAEAQALQFRELRGRWNILQGHLAVHEALAADSKDLRDAALGTALTNYKIGFPLVTHGWVGSYGASAIPEEFRKFRDLAWRLPAETRAHWRQDLYQAWSAEAKSASQLLARLEELY
jgi:tetratricopeptide (TPR) repeat protein